MTHPADHPVQTCVTCFAEVRHRPVFHVGLTFCCAGCVAGGPCTCSYDEDPAAGSDAADATRRLPARPGDLVPTAR